MQSTKIILDGVGDTLSMHPSMVVEVAGYTDIRGDFKHNVWLSQRRAESVRAYLVKKGISPDSLTAKGFGPESPLLIMLQGQVVQRIDV